MIERIDIRTVAETEYDSFSRKTDFEPYGIIVGRFKIHKSCNRCVGVIVSTDPTIIAEIRDKVIV